MKKLFRLPAMATLCLAVLLFTVPTMAQVTITSSKAIGGSLDDRFYDMAKTPDGGHVQVGAIFSNDAGAANKHGGTDNSDAWLVITDSVGNVTMNVLFGGKKPDWFSKVIVHSSGKIIAVGSTSSKEGDISGKYGGATADENFDCWVVVIDQNTGALLGQKCIGGADDDFGANLTEEDDGDIAVVASTESTDEDATGNNGKYDMLGVSMSNDVATIKWKAVYGGSEDDIATYVVHTGDNYIIGGTTTSNDNIFEGYALGGKDGALVYTGGTGNSFYAIVSGSGGDDLLSCSVTLGNSNIVHGGNRGDNGGSDLWNMNLSSDCTTQEWEIINETEGNDSLMAMCLGPNEAIISVGAISTIDGHDALISKVDQSGALKWVSSFGTSGDRAFAAVASTGNKKYATAGWANNLPDGFGGYDGWITYLEEGFGTNANEIAVLDELNIYPNPATDVVTISFANTKEGTYQLFNVTGDLFSVGEIPARQSQIQINCDAFPAGTYFLRHITGDNVTVEEFMVQ